MAAVFSSVSSATKEIKETLKGRKLALFLDYDGTLAEIDPIPERTAMTKEMNAVLRDISCLENVLTVAVSGRQIHDLQKRIGIDHIVYSGNHGLELCLEGMGSEVTYILSKEELNQLRGGIKKVIRDLLDHGLGMECGANIEDKDTAATWHYFGVPPAEKGDIVKEAAAIIQGHGFPIYGGVGCIEVRHPKITKCHAIEKIMIEKIGPNWDNTHSVLFIGDSTEDETGYLDLRKDPNFRGDLVTFIRILNDLRKRSAASQLRTTTTGQYLFRGVDDVYNLLVALRDFYRR